MKNFKTEKTHLDDLFAEARAQNVTPAEELLKTAAPQNSFTSGFAKFGVAGLVAVSAVSFFFLKDEKAVEKSENLLKTQTEIVQNEVFKKEIAQENSAVKLPFKNTEKTDSKVFKKKAETQEIAKTEETKYELKELHPSPQSIQLSAIPLVELRDFELKNLGIEVLKDGEFSFTWAHNNTHVSTLIGDAERPPVPKIQEVVLHEHLKNPPPTFVPIRITDITGKKELFSAANDVARKIEEKEIPSDILHFYQWGPQGKPLGEDFKERLENWIRRQQIIRDSVNKLSKFLPIKAGNFIVWYSPSEEVLERLPDFTANTIRAELSGKDLVIQTEEFREEYPTSGYCYLDMCEKASGAIICSKISPNPAQDKRTVLSYELAEERNIITALYDLSGRKLREFSSLKTRQKGKHEDEISLEGVEKGIYLVAIITDHGEKLSRRIIID